MIKYSILKIKIIFLITVLIMSGSTVNSAMIDGIFFNNEYSLSSVKLSLRGYSILNYMMIIKAYAGAFYLESGTPSGQALSDKPRILELYYFHKISAEDFRESTIEMIKKNTDTAGFIRIKKQIDTFNGFYRDVNPGDRYRAEYNPGKGTTLYLNGKSLGTINGDEFSKAFFSIWIGNNPIDKKFRDSLLGKK